MKWQWEHIEYAWFLAALLPLLLMFLWYRRWSKKRLEKLGEVNLILRLFPEKAGAKRVIKFTFIWIAIAAIALALMNLQVGDEYKKVTVQGVDVVVILDVSKSMEAVDVQPNRLEKAKQFVSNYIDRMDGDRIGVVVFSGIADKHVTLTDDYGGAKARLKLIKTGMLDGLVPGTSMAEAMQTGRSCFDSDEDQYKVMVILTDGENHEEDALAEAELCREEGIVIYTIGVGSEKGGPIPVYNKKGDQVDYHRDKDDNIVFTQLNEAMLTEVADIGEGEFLRLTSGNETLEQLSSKIGGMEGKEFESKKLNNPRYLFQAFLALAIILLILEMLLSEKRSKVQVNLNFSKRRATSMKLLKTILIPTLLVLHFSASAQKEARLVWIGNQLYKNDRFTEASDLYGQAFAGDPELAAAFYNNGNAQFNLDSFENAIENYRVAANFLENPERKASAFHNIGNAYCGMEDYSKAVGSYIDALKQVPDDMDTKYNLAYAQLMLKNNPNEGGGGQNDDQQEDDQEDEQEEQEQPQDGEDEQEQENEQEQQGQQPEMTEEQMEQLLEAARKQEEASQEEYDKKKMKVYQVEVEKDW